MKKKFFSRLLLNTCIVIFLGTLTACGGGGDGSTSDSSAADVRAKYVGQWRGSCDSYSSSTSEDSIVTLTLSGTHRIAISTIAYSYANTTCSGTPTTADPISGLIELTGTKYIGDGVEVDKIRPVDANGQTASNPAVMTVIENKLYINEAEDDGSVPVDADGYPNALDADLYLTKIAD